MIAMQLADLSHLPVNERRRPHAGRQGARLGQVEQHGGQDVVLVVEAHATYQVRGVLLGRQPAGRFAGGSPPGEHEHRGTARLAVPEGIGVNGNKQVSMILACDLHSLA